MVRMSRTSGTLLRTTGLSVSRAAQTSGSEAFLAPEMRTVPSRGLPPTTRIFSTGSVYDGSEPAACEPAARPPPRGMPWRSGTTLLDAEAFALGRRPITSSAMPMADLDDQGAARAAAGGGPRRPGGGRGRGASGAGTRARRRLVVADLGREARRLGLGRRREGWTRPGGPTRRDSMSRSGMADRPDRSARGPRGRDGAHSSRATSRAAWEMSTACTSRPAAPRRGSGRCSPLPVPTSTTTGARPPAGARAPPRPAAPSPAGG